jgi:cell envelope opacity-associated protein A
MSSNEEHEELTADDIAWSNMSYSERLVWWVNNKVLSKSEQSTKEEQPQSIVVEDKPQEVVPEQPEQAVTQVAAEEVIETITQEEKPAGDSSPVKKRSGKGKKINISLE